MAEKRLIDANWLLGEIEHDIGCFELDRLTADDALYVELRDVVRMIFAAPTEPAVQPTRCKDCKRFESLHIRPYLGMCSEWDAVVSETGYCHRAERRADETDHSR